MKCMGIKIVIIEHLFYSVKHAQNWKIIICFLSYAAILVLLENGLWLFITISYDL